MTEENIGGAGDLKAQIKKAIGVHGLWKSRIMQAAQTGESEWDPAKVAPSGNCDFGKWLNNFPHASRTGNYKAVHDLHAEFHTEAARVLALALSGKTTEAQDALKLGGHYANLTSKLTSAMMAWERGQ